MGVQVALFQELETVSRYQESQDDYIAAQDIKVSIIVRRANIFQPAGPS